MSLARASIRKANLFPMPVIVRTVTTISIVASVTPNSAPCFPPTLRASRILTIHTPAVSEACTSGPLTLSFFAFC